MTTTIPNPLRTGEYLMDGGSYTGDVGSVDGGEAILDMQNGANATVTVKGLPTDPTSQNEHDAVFHVTAPGAAEASPTAKTGQTETLDLTVGGTQATPWQLGKASVIIRSGTSLTGSFTVEPTIGQVSLPHHCPACSGPVVPNNSNLARCQPSIRPGTSRLLRTSCAQARLGPLPDDVPLKLRSDT